MPELSIVHVDTGRRDGGGQRQVAQLVLGLATRGHRCRVICPPQSPIPQLLTNANALGSNLQLLPVPCISTWDVRSAWQIKHAAEGADLLHAHDARSHSLARLAETLGARAPLVVHRRVTFPVRTSLLRDWKYGHGVDAFVAISEAVRQELQHGGVDPNLIHIIPSCVDLDRFSSIPGDDPAYRRQIGLPEGVPIVLTVGRLSEEKDHQTLIRAVGGLHERGLDAALLIVGEGPLRLKLWECGKSLAPQRFFMPGHRDDIPHLLGLASVFVLASRCEGFCTALYEAMAAGVPVVSTACGGAEMFLRDGVNGWLVPVGHAERMAEAIAASLLHDRAVIEMVDNARTVVRENLHPNKMVENVLQLYRNVLDRSV